MAQYFRILNGQGSYLGDVDASTFAPIVEIIPGMPPVPTLRAIPAWARPGYIVDGDRIIAID
jgi:hypothetical protein